MQLDQTILMIGQKPVTLADMLMVGAVFALLLLITSVIFAWRAQSSRRGEAGEMLKRTADLEYRLAEMTGHLRGLTEQSQGAHSNLARLVDERLDQVGEKLGLGLSSHGEKTVQSLTKLYERLAVIDTAQKNLTALSTEMLSLKDILSNKQARGAYGQGRMEAIIRDGLHQSAYVMQGTLSNGTRPDCLVKLPDSELRLVIDAKFPLEAFNALKQARGEGELRAAEARVRTDIQKHLKDIAEKYLIPGETHETAVMFVPSESVYAELYERFEDVIQKAHRAHVVIASPNVLMLLVQTMQAIFKDARMREQAGKIQVEVMKLLEDVGRLKDRVIDLQKHFGLASGDLDKLIAVTDRIAKRGLRIESLDVDDNQQLPLPDSKPRLVGHGPPGG